MIESTEISKQVIWRCPVCNCSFIGSGINAGNRCTACDFTVTQKSGIPVMGSFDETSGQTGMSRILSDFFSYPLLSHLRTFLEQPAQIDLKPYIARRQVLDVGCGPSYRQKHLSFEPSEAAEFVGIDSFIPFLANVRKENPETNLTFAQASLDKLPFPDRSFDTVLALFVLHHVPGNPFKLLGELARVTRSHLIIFDHVRSERGLARCVQDLYWRNVDGGCRYLTSRQWRDCFSRAGMSILLENRSGPFGQVTRMILKPMS
ncbi:MAG: methyltransferase domain-containing protein [Candidatus Riflebacteria bacterium]|nr:methyltransferase domain-containing protein [Candidatus Riflebacteria bacterium]